ncbi:hypothetical protein GCM10011369_27080 [Neiella marina]|uniref:Pvc16 N-terminal domain-containing protein n=1 Tax=Neiella marina TaxID=508461 RepID=A0A8J2U7E3_9GAMM|nr:DUF4255 domain-containing protein [Neiella marina]GGA83647.1 hypothetical protein GCM10011369_27080 [Neiella marina]
MLDTALQFIADQSNDFLKAKTGVTDNIVKLGQVVDDNGKYAIGKESIALTLLNMEQEATARQQLPSNSFVNGKTVKLPPELRLNLYVMLVARFTEYDQALKYLSLLMTFFQSHSVFRAEQNPGLSQQISRISLDLQSLSYDQLNQIWAFLGGKHLPSVMYKIRLVSLHDQALATIGPPVLSVHSNINSAEHRS